MAKRPTRGRPVGEEASVPSGPEDLPERWSAHRKMEPVLGLLGGEPLDAVNWGTRKAEFPRRCTLCTSGSRRLHSFDRPPSPNMLDTVASLVS